MKSLILLFFTLITSVCSSAVPEDPKEMTVYIFERLADFDFPEIAKYTHPDDLTRFKQLQVDAAKLSEEVGFHQYFQLIPWAKSSRDISSMEAADVYKNTFKGIFGLIGEHAKDEVEILKQQIKGTRIEILGQTDEKDDTVYVVYRSVTIAEGVEKRSLNVQGFRRYKKRWLCLIDEESFNKTRETIARLTETKSKATQAPRPTPAIVK